MTRWHDDRKRLTVFYIVCILCILFYWQQHHNIVQVRLIHRLSEQLGALFKLFDKIISQRRGGEREQTEYKVILPSLPPPHRSRPGPRDIRDTWHVTDAGHAGLQPSRPRLDCRHLRHVVPGQEIPPVKTTGEANGNIRHNIIQSNQSIKSTRRQHACWKLPVS